jgi:MraZ protein
MLSAKSPVKSGSFESRRKMMLFGKTTLSLNEKNQLSLPSDFREAMSNTVYITQGFDRNLFLLPVQAFNTIYSHVKENSISDPLARLLSRLFLGSATEVVINDQGQVELPLELCEFAGLSKGIVLVGQGEYLEIWSPELWKDQNDSMKNYDANINRFEKFNVSLA